jgi:integrase
MHAQTQVQDKSERLFLNSIPSEYSRAAYKKYLHKYLELVGYPDLSSLLSKEHKVIENQMIEFIISLKENGMKRAAITNYIKPVISCCKINDIMINTTKVNKFMPANVKNRKSRAYTVGEIQKLLDIADERLRAAILILSSTGMRIGGLVGLTVGNLEAVENNRLYKVTVYENQPEEYVTFTTSEAKEKGIDSYLGMRERYGEVILPSTPLIREQFDKRDPFAAAHPRHVHVITIAKKISELAEATGLRTRLERRKGISHRKEVPNCNGFRRYHSTMLVNSSLTTELRWLLEGHNLKGNDTSYVRVTVDDLLRQYLLAHDNLIIDQSHRLMERIQKLEVEKTQFDRLAAQIKALEAKIK